MSTARQLTPISVAEYLAGEESAQRKHEYVDGMIYAMVGGRYAHNLIASNVLIDLGSQLKGKPCRALNSDNKVRTQHGSRIRFYYPDVSVVCGANIRDGVYQDSPTLVVEVLSRSTRRIDEGEKQEAYLRIDSLSVYILLEQEFPAAIVYRRQGNEFHRQIYHGLEQIIELPEIDAALALKAAYAEVRFTPEPVDDND
jgi:Uma2 family endonuclease